MDNWYDKANPSRLFLTTFHEVILIHGLYQKIRKSLLGLTIFWLKVKVIIANKMGDVLTKTQSNLRRAWIVANTAQKTHWRSLWPCMHTYIDEASYQYLYWTFISRISHTSFFIRLISSQSIQSGNLSQMQDIPPKAPILICGWY